jgi:hypothetical protein
VTEQELLADCLQRLNQSAIAYFLTGSMASNYWGLPRTTHDLDFVIQLPPSSIPKLTAAFSADFYLDESSVRSAYQPPYQFNAIDLRSSLKVDFWLTKSTPFDREMFERRRSVMLFSVPAWIASAEDVILHKLLWNQISPSERQLGDAAGVVAVQRESMDLTYLLDWSARLGVTETLTAILEGRIKPKTT